MPIFVGTAVFFVNFLLMIIFGVIVSIALIPMAVISALLVIVGTLLIAGNLKDIDFTDFTEYFPAVIMVLMIVLTFNIADGIGWGFTFYIFLKVCSGKHAAVSKIMYVLSGVFVAYFVLKFI